MKNEENSTEKLKHFRRLRHFLGIKDIENFNNNLSSENNNDKKKNLIKFSKEDELGSFAISKSNLLNRFITTSNKKEGKKTHELDKTYFSKNIEKLITELTHIATKNSFGVYIKLVNLAKDTIDKGTQPIAESSNKGQELLNSTQEVLLSAPAMLGSDTDDLENRVLDAKKQNLAHYNVTANHLFESEPRKPHSNSLVLTSNPLYKENIVETETTLEGPLLDLKLKTHTLEYSSLNENIDEILGGTGAYSIESLPKNHNQDVTLLKSTNSIFTKCFLHKNRDSLGVNYQSKYIVNSSLKDDFKKNSFTENAFTLSQFSTNSGKFNNKFVAFMPEGVAEMRLKYDFAFADKNCYLIIKRDGDKSLKVQEIMEGNLTEKLFKSSQTPIKSASLLIYDGVLKKAQRVEIDDIAQLSYKERAPRSSLSPTKIATLEKNNNERQ